MIKFSAPGKIHLLGEHAVVYGKPALLAAIDLRATVTIESQTGHLSGKEYLRKIIEPIVKKSLSIKKIPPYKLTIASQIPTGSGLGSSAAISTAYIAALLSFLKVEWDLSLINDLTYKAEEVFHGNPSGGDNSTIVFGGLIWFRKESPELKIIHPIDFSIPPQLSKNFILINTGTPKESTKEMVEKVKKLNDRNPKVVNRFLEDQEVLVRELLSVIKDGNENRLIQIIKAGEENLESIGVVSPYVTSVIRKIEKAGGAAKICGAGGKTKATGILLAYHPKKATLEKVAELNNLPCFNTSLGVEGIRIEK